MLPGSDSAGLVSWTGWDVRGGAAGEGGAETFEGTAPSGPGAEERYELLAVAARGFRPPRFLTVGELTAGGPPEGPDDADPGAAHPGLRQTWSLVYRRLTATGPRLVRPYALYLLGVNPPDGVGDDELEVFNDFYTRVHLPEVAERRQALRAERQELVHEIRPPFRGAPRFLALYEVDEESASRRRHTGPPYTRGPEVWQRHTTPWRLWYRRLGPASSAD